MGIFDDFDVARRFSSQLTSQTPEPARHERYGREYGLFMEAYSRLEPWFDKL